MQTSSTGGEPHAPGNGATVGVHLGRDRLRAVEVRHGVVTAVVEEPIAPGTRVESAEFAALLKRTLSDLGSGVRRASLWVVGAFPSLQVRFLSVPKTRAGRVSGTVYWAFRKEMPFDPAIARFDYSLEGEATAEGGRKLLVTAYTVARQEVEALHHAFERAGLTVRGIVVPCFAIRNLLQSRWVDVAGPTVMTLQVCDEASSVLILRDGAVVANRMFQTGIGSLAGAIRDRWPQLSPAQIRTLLRWAGGMPVSEPIPDLGGDSATEEGVRHVMAPALERIAQQVERTMAAYLVGRSGEEIPVIHVLGELAGYPRLVEAIGDQFGIEARPVDPLAQRHWGPKSPRSPPDPFAWGLAVGAALSTPSRTPNLLHTYVEREKEQRAMRASLGTVLTGLAVLAALFASLGIAQGRSRRLGRELAAARQDLARYEPRPDREAVSRLAADVQEAHGLIRSMARERIPLAVLSELAFLTPADIRITALTYAHKGRGPNKPGERVVVGMEGHVLGPWGVQDSKLASYALLLEDSPVFQTVTVRESSAATEGSEQVLAFTLEIEVIDELPDGAGAPSGTGMGAKTP